MEFKESGLIFKFGEQWEVTQLDTEKDYANVCNKIPGTKSIDFIGINKSEDMLVLIEVKGFRGYGKQNSIQNRLSGKQDDIIIEIAQKVRDSLAVILGGCRNSTNQTELWKACIKHIKDNKKVRIIAWLEIDESTEVMLRRAKVQMSIRRKELRKILLWLTSDIDILNTKSYNNEINGISVAISL